METIPIYLSLGLTTRARDRKLYDRIFRKAEANLSKGLNSRIPFLKKTLCNQHVPDAESSKIHSIKSKKAKVGDVFELTKDWAFYFRFKGFLEGICIFNSQNASQGLQAVPVTVEERPSMRYVVSECEIRYMGDLKVTRPKMEEPDHQLGGEGVYNPPLFEIFLKRDQRYYSLESVMCHETEHAVHFSLWHLSGFPFWLFDSDNAEYLAMLKTIQIIGDPYPLLAVENRYIQFQHFQENKAREIALKSLTAPHLRAAKRFIKILNSKYGFDEQEIAMGIAWSMKEKIEQSLDQSWADQLDRMRIAAANEYALGYKELFGLSLEDIREIIANLPMI